MIKVIFIKKEKCNSTYAYNFIEISGHASYNSNISLPCAAISFLIQSVSGFLKLHNIEACQDDGDTCSFNLDKLKQFDPDLVDYFVFSLKLIARDFPDDISIIC
ncbi:MAG TPA: ribosomal-processing cysteine protease Prp [Exilispira sp.]|nr:ribosomal-processing cysteine protease Prp [Exilispira sp.]